MKKEAIRCRECGQVIQFKRDRNGKARAVNPAAVYYDSEPGGNAYVIDDAGRIMRASVGWEYEQVHRSQDPIFVGWVLHRCTCKGAARRVPERVERSTKRETTPQRSSRQVSIYERNI